MSIKLENFVIDRLIIHEFFKRDAFRGGIILKIKKNIVLIFFAIIALFIPCLNALGFDWDLLYYRNQYFQIANIIVIFTILIIPILSTIFYKIIQKI